MITEITGIIISYFLGSIPSAVWVGKIFFQTDVREHGSGNAGATNTIRVLGWKAGIPVLLFDIFKGWLAIWLGYYFWETQYILSLEDYRVLLALATVAGHVFPIFAGFRGGKGIATLFGIGLGLFPTAALVALGIFLATVILTRYVSLGSILATLTFPINEILILGHQSHLSKMILAILVGVFAILTHRKNIQRLLNGSESKIKFSK